MNILHESEKLHVEQVVLEYLITKIDQERNEKLHCYDFKKDLKTFLSSLLNMQIMQIITHTDN